MCESKRDRLEDMNCKKYENIYDIFTVFFMLNRQLSMSRIVITNKHLINSLDIDSLDMECRKDIVLLYHLLSSQAEMKR